MAIKERRFTLDGGKEISPISFINGAFTEKTINQARKSNTLSEEVENSVVNLTSYKNPVIKAASDVVDDVKVTRDQIINGIVDTFDVPSGDRSTLSSAISSLTNEDISKIEAKGKILIKDTPATSFICDLLGFLNDGAGLFNLGLILSGLISISYDECTKGLFKLVADAVDNEDLKKALAINSMNDAVLSKNSRYMLDVATHESAKDLHIFRPTVSKDIAKNFNREDFDVGLSSSDLATELKTGLDNVHPRWKDTSDTNSGIYMHNLSNDFKDILANDLPTRDFNDDGAITPLVEDQKLSIAAKLNKTKTVLNTSYA